MRMYCLFSFSKSAAWIVLLLALVACNSSPARQVTEINIGMHHDNVLQVQIDVTTNGSCKAYAEYWPDSLGEKAKMRSVISEKGRQHALVLTNIIADTRYRFHVVTEDGKGNTVGKTYDFRSRSFPVWLVDQFKYSCPDESLLPPGFKEGFMLMNKRETPGFLYIVDVKGRLRWYHNIDGKGFKVTHFTPDNTIISILGNNDEPTSYGSEILEVNLLGDTLLHLKKGAGDFTQTIHHEILKTGNSIVTLYVDNRVMDLSSIGGGKKDTVNGDGILVLDRSGHKIWQWSVFDVMDPLKDSGLLKDRKDWMHANSLNYDLDSNYIISFYNNGQIWKLDRHTGRIIWKLGKGGTVKMPADAQFDMAHAVHINPDGNLMFFDNGVDKHQSEVLAFSMNDSLKTASLNMKIRLPKEIYNDRMGSAYMIAEDAVLCCTSKRHITVLVNRKGVLLWTLNTAIPPYRVEFIRPDRVKPFILN
jgi:arylsulfate sulfotransferase